jgi:hypothetical protein
MSSPPPFFIPSHSFYSLTPQTKGPLTIVISANMMADGIKADTSDGRPQFRVNI